MVVVLAVLLRHNDKLHIYDGNYEDMDVLSINYHLLAGLGWPSRKISSNNSSRRGVCEAVEGSIKSPPPKEEEGSGWEWLGTGMFHWLRIHIRWMMHGFEAFIGLLFLQQQATSGGKGMWWCLGTQAL